MSLQETFTRIKTYFSEKDHKVISRGQLPMRSTEVGFWGVSNVDDVKAFFDAIRLPKETRFLDIGCGDGRVVAVAAQYVEASGVEYDAALAQEAKTALKTLGIDADIHQGDVMELNLSEYDVLYLYADRNFSYLKEKLLNEFSGTLYLYHDTYHPDFLKKGKTTWVGQIPIFSYAAPTDEE